MNFDFTEEQEMLRDTLSRFLREKYDFETRNKIIKSEEGWSRDIWNQLAEMGLMAAGFSEDYDGFGGTCADFNVIMEEFGKALLIEPYLPTVILSGGVLVETGGDIAKALIEEIASGALIMGLGYAEPKSRFDLFHVETTATKSGDDYVLNGQKAVVLGASIADKLIVSARTSGDVREEQGISLFLLDKDAEGVSIDGYQTIDGMQAGEVILDNVKLPASALLGEEGAAFPIIEKVIDKAIVAISGEAMGVCTKMSELTSEYCRTREQFGVPISKFQVLQHKMVDMFIHTEEMKSMAYMATVKTDTAGFNTKEASSMAKVQLGKSCKFVGENAIQLHGGMGITEELAVGHYFMHATMLDTLFGNQDHHMRRYQREAGLATC